MHLAHNAQMNLTRHFSRFLNAAPGRLHFAAHSHHPWPNVSYAAHQQAWMEAARLADLKWDRVFDTVLPTAQKHVAHVLGLPDPKTICFAPSVHELLVRLLSSFEQETLRILTTDSEFYSFSRQMLRLEETGAVQMTRVPVQPFATFETRFAAEAARGGHDLVYFSQVFFNSGFRIQNLEALVRAVADAKTVIVIDGYHGYMAVPTDLSKIAARVFYAAGGYKYAMCGEGVCFMHCPPGYAERPSNTGWFTMFGSLTKSQDPAVAPYPDDGQRFMGGTYDPTGLHRLNAVMAWLKKEKVTVPAIHDWAQALQKKFLELREKHGLLPCAELIPPHDTPRGNFLIFRHPNAGVWRQKLLKAGVVTDVRDDRLRIGFGLYHRSRDITALARKLRRLKLT